MENRDSFLLPVIRVRRLLPEQNQNLVMNALLQPCQKKITY